MLHDKKMNNKIINIIKLNLILKNKIIKIKLYKKDFNIIKIFLKLNIIKNIKLYTNSKNIYILNLNINNNYKNINNLYKPSKLIFIKLKELIKINRKNSKIFFLSTTTGIISNFEAEKKKIGGLMLLNL